MNKKILYLVLMVLVIIDFGYSFYQYYHSPLFGDMADVIMPTKDYGYYKVLSDPFGIDVIKNNAIYPNPNRFFAHYITSQYFLTAPLILQNFTNPINSIYLSSAIIKIITHLLIVYLLATYISKTKNIFKFNFIIATILIIPFFQYNGYNRYMGIIDKSAIYTFFYALSLAFLLYFYYPFYQNIYNNKSLKFTYAKHIFYLFFIIFLSFNGPLITGVALIVNTIILFNMFINKYNQTTNNLPLFTRFIISIKKLIKFIYSILFYSIY